MVGVEQHVWRAAEPLAWSFHRGTARWMFNAVGGESPPMLPGRERPGAGFVPLPSAHEPSGSLGEVIRGRVSCRRFADTPVALPDLATMLPVRIAAPATAMMTPRMRWTHPHVDALKVKT